MLQKDLAIALDISPSMVSKLAKKGMPTDSVERARRWRDRHLEPFRRKEHRADAPRALAVAAAVPADAELLARAQRFMDVASIAHQACRLPLVAEDLRAAMRAVPAAARHGLLVDADVMDALTAPVHDALREFVADVEAEQQPGAEPPSPPTGEEELEFMSNFWYSVACGEMVCT
jgi:hypothetical protein